MGPADQTRPVRSDAFKNIKKPNRIRLYKTRWCMVQPDSIEQVISVRLTNPIKSGCTKICSLERGKTSSGYLCASSIVLPFIGVPRKRYTEFRQGSFPVCCDGSPDRPSKG